MLNDQQFESKWTEIKSGLRTLWGKLTDDEVESVKGNLSEVIDIVEAKYGETKNDIKAKLDQLMDSFDNDTDKNISPDVSSYQRSPLGGPAKQGEYNSEFDVDRNARH